MYVVDSYGDDDVAYDLHSFLTPAAPERKADSPRPRDRATPAQVTAGFGVAGKITGAAAKLGERGALKV